MAVATRVLKLDGGSLSGVELSGERSDRGAMRYSPPPRSIILRTDIMVRGKSAYRATVLGWGAQ